MENYQEPQTPKMNKGFKAFLWAVCIVAISVATYFIAPGLSVTPSKDLQGLELDNDKLNNETKGAEMPLPGLDVSTDMAKKPLVRIAEYAWNGNSGMIAANGGPRTTKGSLMEINGVNLEIVRQDAVGALRDMQIKFVEEYDKGVAQPVSDKGAWGVCVMGDGGPFYVTTLQQSLDEKFGKNKYHAQIIAAIGLSYGEDKLIGPKEWKDNGHSMEGALISTVVGDGDHILALNYIFSNKGLHVNPDVTTYDPHAVNFTPSENDDYINSVKELIKSQQTGFTIPLKEVVDGKLTGKTINKKIDGATTWTPGDKIAFDALTGFTDVTSTKDFINQMATSLIVIKEWAVENEKTVSALLKATYIANNQIKLYDTWARKASECVQKTYGGDGAEYWYTMFKGVKKTKDGLDYNLGGTRVLNYADAMQYYGITDGKNRYKSVYNQISGYLTELNPCGFNQTCKEGVVPFDNAVNLYFLKNVTIDSDAGKAEKIDYTATKTEVMATGQWNINFETGSTVINGSASEKDLESIYNLLTTAEGAKLKIVGHTDNTGSPTANLELSKGRAQSVVTYLTNKGIAASRFQEVDGQGQNKPVADNKTTAGKAKNRRVDITLLK